MEFSAEVIADFLKGEIVGDPSIVVSGVSKIEEGTPGTLAFLSNPQYIKYVYDSKASIVLINADFELKQQPKATLIKVPDAYEAFASLLQLAEAAKPKKQGIEAQSFISDSATVGENGYVGAFAYIGENVKLGNNVRIYPHAFVGDNVTIGDGSTIFAGAKIYESCILGKDVTIHAGAVIGADGFGFAPSSANDYKKIPQIGNVILEDHVEIGANATIDRATMGSTIIRKGVKLDNMNHVGHNVEIGANTVMAAQGGIAGSTKVGENCMFGGQVGIAPHITVADGTKAAAKAGIGSNVKKKDSILMGAPAFDLSEFRRSFVMFKRLPELYSMLRDAQQKIEDMLKTK